MKKLLLPIIFLFSSVAVIAQDLPENPEPGKCYVRCKTPDVWKNETVTLEVYPAKNMLRIRQFIKQLLKKYL